MTSPARGPTAPPRRLAIVIAIVGLGVLLVALLAVTGVLAADRLGLFEPPPANPAPWRRGEPVTPQPTSDAQVASVARAQQYEQAWRARAQRDRGEATAQLDPTYRFDPSARRGAPDRTPAGTVAGLTVRPYGGSADAPEPWIELTELDTAEHATDLRDQQRRRLGGQATDVTVTADQPGILVQHPSGTSPCPSAVGLTLFTVVAERTLVNASLDCVPDAGDLTGAGRALTERAGVAVAVSTEVSKLSLPATWLDRTAEVPVISTGSWSAEQIVVAGRTDGIDGDALLPAPFAGSGVQVAVDGFARVYAYADAAAAQRVMARVPATPGDNSFPDPPAPADPDGADERLCTTAIHYQLGTRCFSQVGRFVAVDTTAAKDAAQLHQAQIRALRAAS